MQITQNTKISVLIRENPDVIDAIASINKHFEKLRNPILRKVLASRVTIADAARIGKCPVSMFFEKLRPLGFVVKNDDGAKEEGTAGKIPVAPDFTSNITKTLDVREDISNNNDPFNKIMETFNTMTDEDTLLVISPFEPLPLVRVAGRQGYLSYIEKEREDLVRTYFKKSGDKTKDPVPITADNSDFESVVQRFAERTKTIDVRGLEMPQPMITILDELEQLPYNHALYVHHERVPQFLLPEVADRGYTCLYQELSEDDVHLIIYK